MYTLYSTHSVCKQQKRLFKYKEKKIDTEKVIFILFPAKYANRRPHVSFDKFTYWYILLKIKFNKLERILTMIKLLWEKLQ